MDRNRAIYQAYLAILHEELVPAMGCTEPIAVAYAGAPARKTLGAVPEKAELTVSGNIIKNVKSAIVPRTGGRKGLRTALAAGICYGDSDRELEVLANAAGEQQAELDSYLGTVDISIKESVPLICRRLSGRKRTRPISASSAATPMACWGCRRICATVSSTAATAFW